VTAAGPWAAPLATSIICNSPYSLDNF
jgi:hypothetical protein